MPDHVTTPASTISGQEAAKVARILRQTERVPLAQLCRQIQHESSRAHARWEARLDWPTTFAARYGVALDAALAPPDTAPTHPAGWTTPAPAQLVLTIPEPATPPHPRETAQQRIAALEARLACYEQCFGVHFTDAS